LFIGYPHRAMRPVLRPGMSPVEKRTAILEAGLQVRHQRAQHRLLCADVHTGRHVWEQEISGDVITAPVIDGDQVFLTCLDGMSYCLNIADGTVLWSKPNAGTSAPLVAGGRVIMTEKAQVGSAAFQCLRRAQRASGNDFDERDILCYESPYLHRRRGGGSGIKPGLGGKLDAEVGFATAPPSAKLGAAGDHLGVASVSGAWAYQGSRSAFCKGRIFSSPGRRVCCVRDADGQVAWEAEARGSDVDPDEQIFLPPALGHVDLYLASMPGHIVSLHQETGATGFLYHTGRPIAFQPCLAKGRIHFGTANGELVCLDTGNDDADGWYMWGGNAQHNKIK
jgi:Ca-activated chloride channel homolog